MKFDELKAFAAWKEAEQNLRYADNVVPAGVRGREQDHRDSLFEAQHDRAKAFEYAERVLRYATEVSIYCERGDRKATRRFISQLQRYGGYLRMIGYRSWLGLNGDKLYPTAELKIMRSLVSFFGYMIQRLESYRDRLDEQAEEELALLDDLVESLQVAHEWLGLQSERQDGQSWDDLLPSATTIAAIEGREVQVAVQGEVLDESQLLTTKQAADFLGLTAYYMKQMRHYNTGPAFLRMKSRRGNFETVVVYQRQDVLDWLASKPDTLRKAVHRAAPAIQALRDMEVVF